MDTPSPAGFVCWHVAVTEVRESNAVIERRNRSDMIVLSSSESLRRQPMPGIDPGIGLIGVLRES
jgi:hypothetical protein